jgi:hypothetical protein
MLAPPIPRTVTGIFDLPSPLVLVCVFDTIILTTCFFFADIRLAKRKNAAAVDAKSSTGCGIFSLPEE